MKKKIMTVAILVLVLMLGISPALAASAIPKSRVNPKQSGHVAYLESQYGTSQAKKIVKDYGRNANDENKKAATEPAVTPQPTPGTYWPGPGNWRPWVNVTAGQYFIWEGRTYMAGQRVLIGQAWALVAYPVDAYGYVNTAFPQYFYL